MISGHFSGFERTRGRWQWSRHCGFHVSALAVYFYFNSLSIKEMASQTSGAFTDLGKREDLYYTDPDNCKVESIPVEYNTRYSQDFSNKSSGKSFNHFESPAVVCC